MNLKKFGTVVFAFGLLISGLSYGRDYAPKVIEVIEPYRPKPVPYEEDDFIRIRQQRYGNGGNVREFLYFSRWHEYLEEVAEERLRQEEYEYSLRQYETEMERVNRENQRIRQNNQSTTHTNVPQGDSVDVSQTNY